MPLRASAAALKSIAFIDAMASDGLAGEEPTPEMEIPMPTKSPEAQTSLLPEAEGAAPRAEFTAADVTVRFMLGGNAIVTFQSEKTGAHFTYRISTKKGQASPHFVAVLTGPEQYSYLGCIFGGKVYAHGRKSKIGQEAPSAKAFMWAWKKLSAGTMPEVMSVYHEGRCGRCQRRLTDPESIRTGMGSTCAGRAGSSTF
jgi:hypothetical protein